MDRGAWQATVHGVVMQLSKTLVLPVRYSLLLPFKQGVCMHAYLLSCVQFFETPPGYSIHGISQASIPESVVIPFSWGSSQPRD